MIKSLPPASTNSQTAKKSSKTPLFEKMMVFLIMINYGLVIFDYFYTELRDIYLQYLPGITKIYDPVKGIQPHRVTEQYLQTVDQLTSQLTSNSNPAIIQSTLADLSQQSQIMIDENPFAIAGKTGTLEQIKNRVRSHVPNPDNSAKTAFAIFWSVNHLQQQGWSSEIAWFNQKIRPLIASNYYRGFNERGKPINYFWLVDLPFNIIFLLEFLGRTYTISRRHIGVTWKTAMLWRFYDILLFLPAWRFSRIIPLIIRLDASKMFSLQPIQKQIGNYILSSFATELTEIVVIQVIDYMQSAIKSGEISRRLFNLQKRDYIDINNINEIEVIVTRLITVIISQVLPQLKPDIQNLLQYSLNNLLRDTPAYQNLQNIPGINLLVNQLLEQLISQFSLIATAGPDQAYQSLKPAIDDPMTSKLSNQLVTKFSRLLGQELQSEDTLKEIQHLLCTLLEEVKINYVMRVEPADIEKILEETRILQSQAKNQFS